ncbi:MAG: SOS response-associated peptidase family protein [Balneolaceae bacterium]
MIKRVAFFAGKKDVENYFGIQSKREQMFEAHYNLSIGQQLPAVSMEDDAPRINHLRWGKGLHDKEQTGSVSIDDVPDVLKSKETGRCVIPISGFYVWKEKRESDHPFFVRMLNEPFMSIAAVKYTNEEPYFQFITTSSNALIQPMSESMPLMLNKTISHKWLQSVHKTEDLLKDAKSLFLLTDLSVLRVNKRVNDPSQNDPALIQPIPK